MLKNIYYRKIRPAVKENVGKNDKKLLVNPYQGCTHNCLFCPANDGYLRKDAFEHYREKKVISIVENIVDHVKAGVERNPNKDLIVHLSPVADPFQPIEWEFGLSKDVMRYCVLNNVPIALCTKGQCDEEVVELLKQHPRSFAQISLPTLDEQKHKMVVRGDAASVSDLLKTIELLTNSGIATIVRADPVFPFITDDIYEFEHLISVVKELGVHVVLSSVADIMTDALEREKTFLDANMPGIYERYKELYCDYIGNRWHAKLSYRENLFAQQRSVCMAYGISYGITWEPDLQGNHLAYKYNHIETDDIEMVSTLSGN